MIYCIIYVISGQTLIFEQVFIINKAVKIVGEKHEENVADHWYPESDRLRVVIAGCGAESFRIF